MKVAILLTCHNRIRQTLSCLEMAYSALSHMPNYEFRFYLTDDGSTDGTSEAVELSFPEVNIILGNGDLYWNQGMRLAWHTALENEDYDFYIWLNDDTMMYKDALLHLFECYSESYDITGVNTIVVGSCCNNGKGKFSYGGRTDSGPVEPNGRIQNCKYINGNLVLVHSNIVRSIGILSNDYTHGMGDYDYGLSALRNGYNIIITKKFIATCPNNIDTPIWCDSKENLFNRWKHFHSPLGLNIQEYKIFVSKNWPNESLQYIFKAYIKCLMPTVYNRLANYAK